ncbi:MAG: hypothetical protein AAFR03_01165 [Pseudomonadota bacterium]
MTPALMKKIVAGLLLFTGGFHLAVAATTSWEHLSTGLAVFGALYGILGFWTWFGGRSAMMAALLTASVGLGVGGLNYLQNGGPASMLTMFAIDAVVLVLGGLWIRNTPRGAS